MEVWCNYRLNVFSYFCTVPKLTITSPDVEITAFTGGHSRGKSNKSVRDLEVEPNNKVEFLPKDLYKTFPNLSVLKLVSCGLKDVTRHDLKGLHKLIELDLSSNRLKTLPDDLFLFNDNISSINFSSNIFEHLGSKVLEPIKDILKFADFSHTKVNFTFLKGLNADGKQTRVVELIRAIDKVFKLPSLMINCQEWQFETCGQFLDTRKPFNLIIKAEGKVFDAHKEILSLCSPVFEAMFSIEMKEDQTGELVIEDFCANTVQDFVHFLYNGCIKDSENVMELFAMASKYDVAYLVTICEDIIYFNLDDETNALEVLQLGHLYSSDKLKNAAFADIEYLLGTELDASLIGNPQELVEVIKKQRGIIEAKRNLEYSEKVLKVMLKKFKRCATVKPTTTVDLTAAMEIEQIVKKPKLK